MKGASSTMKGAPSTMKGNARLVATPSGALLGAGPSPTYAPNDSSPPTPLETEVEVKAPTPISKAESFLSFLQGNGVRMAFVRTLVALYEEEEKPDEPLPYICTLMGKGLPTEEELLSKQDELSVLRSKYTTQQELNQSLRFRLAKYLTPPEEDGEGHEDFGFQFEYDPNNYNYLNTRLNTVEDEAGQDGDDEETPAPTRGDL